MGNLKQENDVVLKHEEGMGAFVSKQAEDIIIIQNQIADAAAKAEQAISASNRAADMKVGFFFS
jgi:DNA-binding transcriptional regulator YhcF (GntR family)